MHGRGRLVWVMLAVAVACTAGAAQGSVNSVPAVIRVDQLGYAPDETKTAYLLDGAASRRDVSFTVVDTSGRIVLTATGSSVGTWNARYTHVERLDFTELRRAGTYRVRAAGALSPPFRIASRRLLFRPRVLDTVAFFRAQRDGATVIPGALQRRPAHLNDHHARLYAWPRYESADSDVILGRALTPIGGTTDLEGGWMDAGDFVKFTHTTAYADVLLFAAGRALGRTAPWPLLAESRFGLAWLAHAWHPVQRVLDLQVGIGSGNKAGTFHGDHDLWRLPQVDDSLTGTADRYLRNRPAFRANDPGAKLPPNLAGRVAAAFALAAQLDTRSFPRRARRELQTGAAIFAAAKTSRVRAQDVATALPHAFYPESSWHDDLELAGAELALAGQALHDPRATGWLRRGAHWAHAYLTGTETRDSLNLYDTSVLAHTDLVRAMRAAGGAGLEVTTARLIAGLRAQLERSAAVSARDPFRAGVTYSDFDAASHAFGLAATARLYGALTGDRRFASFGTAQRDWALGANPWGASLMIGVGTTFPRCPQHVVANLSGRLDGRPPILVGAVVNGPNSASLFSGGLGGYLSHMRHCPPAGGSDAYRSFTGRASRFVDDVRSWQTVEPAIDFTATAALAFALLS